MSANVEAPKDEMKRKLRKISGAALAGEKDDQLRDRAMRRFNHGLDGKYQISERTARGYWHAEYETIPSIHMDRIRDLAAVHPIQEAIDGVENAVRDLEHLVTEECFGLAERAVASVLRSFVDRIVAARDTAPVDRNARAVRSRGPASGGPVGGAADAEPFPSRSAGFLSTNPGVSSSSLSAG